MTNLKLQLEEEQEAGRRRLARERTEKFELELEAGQRCVERARERLELEQGAGQRTAGKSG